MRVAVTSSSVSRLFIVRLSCQNTQRSHSDSKGAHGILQFSQTPCSARAAPRARKLIVIVRMRNIPYSAHAPRAKRLTSRSSNANCHSSISSELCKMAAFPLVFLYLFMLGGYTAKELQWNSK